MAFENDGCFLCKDAEKLLEKVGSVNILIKYSKHTARPIKLWNLKTKTSVRLWFE